MQLVRLGCWCFGFLAVYITDRGMAYVLFAVDAMYELILIKIIEPLLMCVIDV